MLNIDLGKIVTALGEDTIADIGAPLGLSKELSLKAARSLVENFHGNSDEAIAAMLVLVQDQEASGALRARVSQMVTALGGTLPEASAG